jgi:hypothetical protein
MGGFCFVGSTLLSLVNKRTEGRFSCSFFGRENKGAIPMLYFVFYSSNVSWSNNKYDPFVRAVFFISRN